MAGHITALRFQKHTPDRVNVYLDEVFAFGLPAVDAARLRVGQFLSDGDIARLQDVDVEAKAYDRAVRFLAVRPRSQAEVERHLIQADVAEAVVEIVLARLAKHGYLNDVEFARYWVENRGQFRPKGAQALRSELRSKGLDREVVETAVEGLDETVAAYKSAQPRAARLAALVQSDPQGFRRKMGDFLMRRGFGYQVVREVVERLAQELTGDERMAEDE